MPTERELEILKLLDELRAELHALKGKQIRLCGYCYHIDEGSWKENKNYEEDWEKHKKNSPGCHRRAYPCPLTVYERDVTFDADGRANIK